MEFREEGHRRDRKVTHAEELNKAQTEPEGKDWLAAGLFFYLS